MERVTRAALLLALASTTSGRNLVIGTAIFPFFLPSVFPQAPPFVVALHNRISAHAAGSPLVFPDPSEDYQEEPLGYKSRGQFERATESVNRQKQKNKDDYRPTSSYGYQVDPGQTQSQSYQGATAGATSQRIPHPYASQGLNYQNSQYENSPSQKRPTQYAESNQGQVDRKTAESASSTPQKKPTQFAPSSTQSNQGQNVIGQNYNAAQNAQYGNSGSPIQYADTAQNQQGLDYPSTAGQFVRPAPSQGSQYTQSTQAVALFNDLTGMQPLQQGAGGNVQGKPPANAQIPVRRASAVTTSVTGFGLGIMKALDEEQTGNSVVSPYSIALVLALLQHGTDGESQTQITMALRMTPQVSRELFQEMYASIKSRSSRNILKIATSIFYGEHFVVTRQYKSDAMRYFGSDLRPINVANAQLAAKKVNDWVSASTQGHIPYLVSAETFAGDTQLVLANAIFFKGLWNTTFSPQRTVTRPFKLVGGATKPADFMHHTGEFKTGRDPKQDLDFLVMPFEGFQYSLLVMVPSERTGVSSLLGRLESEDLLGYLSSPRRDAIISVPKFRVRIDTDLFRPLSALGIRDIFTYRSGFLALGTPRGDRPRVTGALHTAVLAIDEQGGSAAAATVLAVSTLSLDSVDLEFKFKADRPFVAMLWDNQLSVPLFIAKINDPTLEN